MASPRPSSSSNTSSSFQTHPSLPQKPPASGNGNPRAFSFKPRSVGNPAPPQSHPSPQPAYPSAYAAPPASYPIQPSFYPQPQSYGYDYSLTTPPQITNPFAPPGQAPDGPTVVGAGAYDSEEAAAIAQWQSTYAVTSEHSNAKSAGGTTAGAAPGPPKQEQSNNPNEKKKTVIRSGGGESWQDESLLEWDPTHPRFFVGNLAGEVSDDSLLKAFSKYPSVVKARVLRDKRTTKSKGFGFISFSNAEDFQRAGKEMQGKYIGSHPITLQRSRTDIKAVNAPDKHKRRGKGGAAGGHASTNAGVQKQQKKNKGGVGVLG